MTPRKLGNPFAVPLGEGSRDFIPVLQGIFQFHFRSDGLLRLMQCELELTPATALGGRIPVRSPRGKMTHRGVPAFASARRPAVFRTTRRARSARRAWVSDRPPAAILAA